MTAMPPGLRGRAAGWYQSGNTGGAAIGGGLVIWLADRVPLPAVAAVAFAAITLPALATLLIDETAPVRRAIGPHLSALASDMQQLFRSRRVWIGAIFILSPVGSAAIGNLIAGMGPDYRASGTEVMWVTGIGSGLFAALGCVIGGAVADRLGRMFSYALAGALACAFALYLGFAPATPLTYAVGYSGYAVAGGFAYAVFTAMVLDILGRRQHAASGYSILNSAGNFPISYMTWLDGWGYQRWGAQGLMTVDAAANGGFAVLLLLVAIAQRRRWDRETSQE